jgi:hypothetical protein
MRPFSTASGIAPTEYLASTVGNRFNSGTVDADTVVTVDSNSKKYLDKGVVLARITSPVAASGLLGPYLESASDGRQTDANIVGINDTFVDLSEGDKEVGYLFEGSVKESKIKFGSQQGTIQGAYKTKLRTEKLDILFPAE